VSEPTLLYVHGTGVRNQSQSVRLEELRSKVKEFELPCVFDECLWGDVHGVNFKGLSLPEPFERDLKEDAQALRWEYLQVDPLFDLKLWCTPAPESSMIVGGSARFLWDKIGKYVPSVELTEMLENEGLEDLFEPAWRTVILSTLPQTAFEGAGNEDASVANVFAEAIVAQMMFDAGEAVPPIGIPLDLRSKIVERLLFDWEQSGKGIQDLFQRYFGRKTRSVIRPMRARASRAFAPAIGDILRYQALGSKIRWLIRKKIDEIPGKVFVLSHSLGGIACFELMVEGPPANVAGLITVGSQAPLFYEFDALQTMRGLTGLPNNFPRWLNIYDENDFLSYCADRVFNCQVDYRVDSVLPPLEAHSAYWKLDGTWLSIRDFIANAS
jgi:hypothetical protein